MKSVFTISALTLSLLLPAAAGAFDGDGPSRFAPGTRVARVAHPAVQARLDQAPAWQDFLDRRGGAWHALWDEATDTPVRFWGEGWDVDPASLAQDDGAIQVAREILAEERWLLGDVALADLVPLTVDRRRGIVTVSFARTYAGLPVDDSLISLRFKADRFVMGQFESMPAIERSLPRSAAPGLTKTQATAAALIALGWAPERTSVVDGGTLVVLPRLTESTAAYDLAWRVELHATTFPSQRIVWVDARTGELLRWDENVRFAAGTVRAEIDDRYPEAGLTEAVMAYAELVSPFGDIDASVVGTFELPDDIGPTELSWTAGSEWFDVRSADSAGLATFTAELSSEGGAILAAPSADLDETATSRVLAQLDTHVAAHRARERALQIDPGFPWAAYRARANVNLDEGACNAYFDGNINFLRQGNGCNNTGRVHDVVAHEYGHGFHGYSIIEGVGSFDGALSEGLGDYMAATISGDPATARGFFRGSDEPLRDIAPNHVWPDHIGEIHYTGIIIAGALWDTRVAMIEQYGEAEGIARADAIFGAVAARATDIPSAYAEALLENDDNGNLADGTPDKCLIDDTFGLHGLGPAAPDAPLFALTINPSDGAAMAGIDLPISLHAELTRPDCSEGEIGDLLVHWTHGAGDLGDFSTVSLEAVGGGEFEGVIPAAESGTFVRWWVEVLDSTGAVAGQLPTGSITDPWFGTWVDGKAWTEVFFADFEDGAAGFTHRLVEGSAQDGADDWQLGTPTGAADDPDHAFSGDNAWGNDLAMLENWNGLYQPNIHNALSAPGIEIPADAVEVHLQFRRWLSVEDGYWDGAFVTVGGAVLWTQHASPTQDDSSAHHQDSHWALRSYDVTDLVDPGSTLDVKWELITDGGLELGGWNLDDVRVVVRRSGAEGTDPGDPVAGGLGADGCTCSSSGAAPSASLLLLLLVPAALRRRR